MAVSTILPSLMELNLPNPHHPIRPRPENLPFPTARRTLAQPKHNIYAPAHRILDRDISQRFLDAPDVYVCVERARCAVERVGGPGEGADAGGVEGPAGSYRLLHVVEVKGTAVRSRKREGEEKEERTLCSLASKRTIFPLDWGRGE